MNYEVNSHYSNSIEFQKRTINMSPRPILLKVLELFDGFTGYAIDLGCGSGADTIKLIEYGWKVIAIDANPNGFENIYANIPRSKLSSIECKQESFENLIIPDVDLVYSSFSIPFCKPEAFNTLGNRIVNAIKDGGRFAGNFFGKKDEWVHVRRDMTFITKEQIFCLFKGLEFEYFNEIYVDKPTLFNKEKRWHIFEVIATRKY